MRSAIEMVKYNTVQYNPHDPTENSSKTVPSRLLFSHETFKKGDWVASGLDKKTIRKTAAKTSAKRRSKWVSEDEGEKTKWRNQGII